MSNDIKLTDATKDKIRLAYGKKKSVLRREAIKAYIKSQPNGTVITLSKFQDVALVPNAGTVQMIITNMIGKGEIRRWNPLPLRTRKYAYEVIEEPQTTQDTAPAVGSNAEHPPKRSFKGTETFEMSIEVPRTFTVKEVEQKAATFLWENGYGRDTLKRFIEYLKENN